jgi:phage shock protein E
MDVDRFNRKTEKNKKEIYIQKRGKQTIDITMEELKNIIMRNSNVILLDVRSPQEYQEGHINGAILIPVYELECKACKMLKNKNEPIIVYCKSGMRSLRAIQILTRLGYMCLYNLKGGLDEYNGHYRKYKEKRKR